jgi:hypothetical protein
MIILCWINSNLDPSKFLLASIVVNEVVDSLLWLCKCWREIVEPMWCLASDWMNFEAKANSYGFPQSKPGLEWPLPEWVRLVSKEGPWSCDPTYFLNSNLVLFAHLGRLTSWWCHRLLLCEKLIRLLQWRFDPSTTFLATYDPNSGLPQILPVIWKWAPIVTHDASH